MMVKRLNFTGKMLHLFTALFPIFIYWTFIFFTKVQSWSFKEIYNKEYIIFILLSILTISSVLIFYFILDKKRKNPDKQVKIFTSTKHSNHIKYVVGSLSPFLLFIVEFFNDTIVVNIGIIVATIMFILIAIILIFKEDTGILYNFLDVKTDKGNVTIISKKDSLTNHVKTIQLDKKVFKEWI